MKKHYKIVICGIGKKFEEIFGPAVYMKHADIVGLFDGNSSKIGTKRNLIFNNQKHIYIIKNTEMVLQDEFDICLIVPDSNRREIRECLVESGVEKHKIAFLHSWIDKDKGLMIYGLSMPYSQNSDKYSLKIFKKLCFIDYITIKAFERFKKLNLYVLEGEYRKNSICATGTVIGESARIISTSRKSVIVGNSTFIKGEINAWGNGKVIIGNHCYIGANTYIWSDKGIHIGDRVLVAHNCNIFDNDTHPLEAEKRAAQFEEIITVGPNDHYNLQSSEIWIGDDVWIAEGCMIMKGVHIGKGSIICSKTRVNNDVPEDSIVYGSPMQIRSIKEHISGEQ